MSRSKSRGDPRVHFIMNLVLSAAFASTVVWGLSFLGVMALTIERVATLTLLLMVITYVVTR